MWGRCGGQCSGLWSSHGAGAPGCPWSCQQRSGRGGQEGGLGPARPRLASQEYLGGLLGREDEGWVLAWNLHCLLACGAPDDLSDLCWGFLSLRTGQGLSIGAGRGSPAAVWVGCCPRPSTGWKLLALPPGFPLADPHPTVRPEQAAK